MSELGFGPEALGKDKAGAMWYIQFRVLYREFLFRMVDLEVLSAHAQGDLSKLFGQFAALLVFLSMLLAFVALGFGGDRSPPVARLITAVGMEHFLIATTMLVVGLFAVLSWDGTFPNRRDVMVLAPLPIRARTMFLAKVAAVATALGLTVVLLHVFAGLVWPLAIANQVTTQTVPALTYDPAMAPVEAADLQSVLNRDFARARAQTLQSGALTPPADTGIAIGVVKHGVRRVFAYGPAKPDSIFEIGSITKTFTGLVLARMLAQGKVKLDQPVRELLPPDTVTKPRGNEITLLDLATQHSGLPRMPDNLQPADKANPYADYRQEDLYAYVAKRGVARPATPAFLYSNLGFGLLGLALANRAGTTWPNLVQEEITGPLGMTDTVVSLSPAQKSRFIQGYDADNHPVPALDLDALAGAGALRSTAGDMLTYLEANLHPEKLSSRLSAALVQSHQLQADVSPGVRIALAWIYATGPGTYWHDGATSGYNSYAFFNPKGDYAAIVLLNNRLTPGGSADLLGEHIRQRLAGQPAISLADALVRANDGVLGLLRVFAVYWITMFAAGAFIFCSVLVVQGLAAQLPRRQFLRLSAFLQMAAFCLLVSVYFLQPSPADIAQNQRLLVWLPSYWFLGLFQMLNGTMHPALVALARRALMGLAVAVGGTAVAYGLSYVRTLRKIVEEPDIVPGTRGAVSLPRFGNALQTAVVQFSARTLLRSRQHRIILAFYLGIGFATVIFFLKTPVAQHQMSAATQSDPWHQVSAPLLASSIVMLGFWVLGTRVVFAMPMDLRANWIFQITPVRGGTRCLSARRRSMLMLALAPVWAGSAMVFLSIWPWRSAAGHLAVLALLGMILVEVCLHGVVKIPFTCSYLPGKSNFHITFWLCTLALVNLLDRAAELERWALEDTARYTTMLVVLAILAVCARWRTVANAKSEETVQFEEVPSDQILVLGLPRDGGLRTEPAIGRQD